MSIYTQFLSNFERVISSLELFIEFWCNDRNCVDFISNLGPFIRNL